MSAESVRSVDTAASGSNLPLARAARGGVANLVGSVVTGVVAFAVAVVVARTLPRPEAGVFFSTTSLFLLVTTLGQLGTATGVVYFIARARELAMPGSIPGIVRVARRPVLAIGLVAATTMVAAAPWTARITLGEHAPSATTCLRVLALFVPVVGLETVWLAASRGFGSMRTNAAVELVGRPLAQVVLVALVLPAGRVDLMVLAWAAPYVVAAALASRAWTRRRATLPAPVPGPSPSSFWRFTGPRAATGVVQMLMQRFDIVLVGALAGAGAAAVYAAATRFVVVGQSVTTAFTQALQPMLGAALVREDRRAAAELYQLSTAWLIVLTWPVYLLLLIFRGRLVDIFGHGYGSGSQVLAWLAVSMLFAVGCGLADVVLSMAGHTGWNLANAVLALGSNLGLDLWLVPRHGILGAAIGWAVAITLRNLAALVQVAVALRVHPFAPATAVAAAIAVGSFGALPWALRAVGGDGLRPLAAAVLVGAVVWCAAVWLGRRSLGLHACYLPILRDSGGRRAEQHGPGVPSRVRRNWIGSSGTTARRRRR
ncbi:flippase [Nocardioides maradonensis]